MKVLVINCGSSSLKYQLIDSETEEVLAKGLCERIGIDGRLTHKPTGKDKVELEVAMPNHTAAVSLVLQELTDEKNGVIASLDEIDVYKRQAPALIVQPLHNGIVAKTVHRKGKSCMGHFHKSIEAPVIPLSLPGIQREKGDIDETAF